MKKLTVIVKPANREDVIDIMESCAVYGVMETDITGYGNQKGYRVMYRGAMSGPNVLMKCKFETVGDDKTIENCASHSLVSILFVGGRYSAGPVSGCCVPVFPPFPSV